MTDIEPFKTRSQIVRESVQEEMVALLEKVLERARRGELSGVAVAMATAESQRAESDWKGWHAPALGNAVACMAQKYFNAQTRKP